MNVAVAMQASAARVQVSARVGRTAPAPAAVRAMPMGLGGRTMRLPTRRSVVVKAEGEDAKKTVDALDSLLAGEEEPAKPEAIYVDEKDDQDEGAFMYRKEMSMEQKKKLRDEIVGFGGSANTKMGANWFLWISVVISVLAVLNWLQGGFDMPDFY